MTEYLTFQQTGDTGKTLIYDVLSKRTKERLATIKWYGPWRQYVLVPEPNTIWNNGCLDAVMHFIGRLMYEKNPPKETPHSSCGYLPSQHFGRGECP